MGQSFGKSRALDVRRISTPLGDVWIAASVRGLRAMTWPGGRREECLRLAGSRSHGWETAAYVVVDDAAEQLAAYFAGSRRHFDLPLDLEGTAFQIDVWNAVAAIPYGSTRTYGEIARLIGRPGAARAVGAANGRNPVSIVVPCHRLIGSNGALRGYAGGVPMKRRLLDLEVRGGAWG